MPNRTGRRRVRGVPNTHRLPSTTKRSRLVALRGAGISKFVAFAAFVLIAAVAAYFTAYSSFYSYDDEGYILLSLKQFATGHHLYSDVYSQYGPFPYELIGG